MCSASWKLLERHLHKYAFQSSGRNQNQNLGVVVTIPLTSSLTGPCCLSRLRFSLIGNVRDENT